MIYTCTMNTAVDLFVETDELLPDVVNRTKDEDYQPNGKGVNISFMLKRLGLDNTALGFTGGFTGRFIENELLNEKSSQTLSKWKASHGSIFLSIQPGNSRL